MKELEQIIFVFNGRKVYAYPLIENLENGGCPEHLLLEPEFLDRLYSLLKEYEMLK